MRNARTAGPNMRNFLLNFIGEQGDSVGLPNTKMAYILTYISHFLNASVSVDRESIAGRGE